jgi:hypothetical protein
MFSFLRNPSSHQPSRALQHALTQQGLPAGLSATTLRVLTTNGRYAGRSVRYFRVFDPLRLAHGDKSVRGFRDLDARPELVLSSGHMEHDGALAMTERLPAMAQPVSPRERADRAAHADDEHLVFWNSQASRSSAQHLSEAAASWHQARSTQPVEPVRELPRLARA